MKLKCIGGLANGRIIDVENYYGEHDIVRVDGKVEFKLDTFNEDLEAFREGRTPESLSVPYYFYKVATIAFTKHRQIKFLIPEKWTPEEAIHYVIGA